MNGTKLKEMYGATPESFKHRVTFALKRTEEKSVKHTMRTVLIAAAIVVVLTATAYAMFSSQVAELFGTFYGEDMQTWLEQGDVATVNRKFVLGEVEFTLEEIVYRENGLYGMGVARPLEGGGATVMPDELEEGINAADYPFGYDVHGASGHREQAPDGAPTYADVALERGGKLYLLSIVPNRVGVDGGMMLSPESVGTALIKQRDGSVGFAFELSDGTAIAKGQLYAIEMWASVCEMSLDGERLADTQITGTWTVEIEPQPISETTAEPAAAPAVPVQSIGDVALTVPDEYTQTGTMPVYAATLRDFGASLNPELFNRSGVAETGKYTLTYNDEAILSWSPETLFYNEYRGTYNGNYKEPESEPMILPLKTLSHAASELAGDVYSGWPDEGESWKGITLEKTALSGITLDDAKAQVEALLKALGVEGYTCDYALDMDAARIQSMGETMNRMIEENRYWNPPIMDYSLVTEADEGFYLHYANGVKTDGGLFDLHAYVTQRGIVDMQLRDMFIRGEVVSTPGALVSPETVMAKLAAEIADSRFSGLSLDHIISLELTYAPARAADKADGMVFTPAWYAVYQDNDGVKYGFDSAAIFNAVDGTLLFAPFQ